MATYSRKRVITERLEWRIPAHTYGAPWAEVVKAATAAGVELRQARGLPPDAFLADDDVTVRPSDDAIIVAIELRETEDLA